MRPPRERRSALPAVAAVLLGLGLWMLALPWPFAVDSGAVAPAAHATSNAPRAKVAAVASTTKGASVPLPAPAAAQRPPPRTERPHDPDPLRHPITADHLRLHRDVDLLDAAWQALKAGDFERARAALAEHRREYPSERDDLNDGLTILSDCMEYRSAEARARAQQFYDEQTHSMVRRRIRRECLEVVR